MTDVSAAAWSARRSIRAHATVAMFAVFGLIGTLGVLATTVTMSGAIVSSGTVVVESHSKTVQHPTGGVVGDIPVHEGMRVRRGDVVLRLDATVLAANLAIVTEGLDELAARAARLEAERAGAAAFTFPTDLTDRARTHPALQKLLASETHVFDDRSKARAGQHDQLTQRIEQTRNQIDGFRQQAEAKADEITLVRDELTGVQQLYAKNLVPLQRVTVLQREEARLRGERGELIASMAQAQGRISETELQILQIGQDLQSEVSTELVKIQSQGAELAERRVTAEDQLARIEIRAPLDGIVQQLAAHTIGGVVAPGAAIMQIVPETDTRVVEAKVGLNDIDQIWLDQPVTLRLSAFNQRTTPELRGKVTLVPADLSTDPRSGAEYYMIRIAIDPNATEAAHVRLVAGMPVECFVQTGQRSVLSYFTKPLADQLQRAFRHD